MELTQQILISIVDKEVMDLDDYDILDHELHIDYGIIF